MVVVYRVHGGAAFVDGGERRVFIITQYLYTFITEPKTALIFVQKKGEYKMQRYYGCGYKAAWVDAFESTETRETRTFGGFTLHNGQVFGRDKKGQFILTRIIECSEGKEGLYATILLYRRHNERGWVLEWERSDTTVNAIVMYRKHNPYARITRESRESHVNPLQEVKGQKYFQLLT